MSSDLVDEVIEKLVPHLFCYLIIAGQASRELLPRNSARRHRWPPSKIGGVKRDMIRKLKENCFAWADTLALSAKEKAPAHCCRGVPSWFCPYAIWGGRRPDGIAYISDSLNLSPMFCRLD